MSFDSNSSMERLSLVTVIFMRECPDQLSQRNKRRPTTNRLELHSGDFHDGLLGNEH
jgi:hypothetical protein